MLSVRLEPYEYERARTIGVERHERYRSFGDAPHYALAWQRTVSADLMDAPELANINGALTEIAVAKLLGVYWHGHGGALDREKRYRKTPDVGDRYEVRHVTNRDHGPIIKDSDLDVARPYLEIWAGHVLGPRILIFGGVNILAGWDLAETCPSCRRYEDQAGERRRICQSHLTIPDSQGRNQQ